MNRLNYGARFFLALFVIAITSIFGGNSAGGGDNRTNGGMEIYLCYDVPSAGGGGECGNGGNENRVKMVYGYINGRRTECMSEAEFLSRYCMPAVIPRPPSIAGALGAPISSPMVRNYVKSNFREADLFGMDFRHADCREADFSKADMRNAKLQNADCTGANFEGAYLKCADLSGADLSGANLKNAYLVSADMRNAKGLTIESIRLAATLHGTRLDEDLRELVNEYCPAKWRDISRNWGVPDDADVRVRRPRSDR